MNLQPSQETARKFWDGQFGDWFRSHAYSDTDATQRFCPNRRAHVLRIVKQQQPGRFFDIGCGGGWLMSSLYELGWQGEGCDFSSAMCRFAAERLAAEGRDGGKVQYARATDLTGIESEAYDLVLNLGPLEYLSDDEFALALGEVRRIARTGGLLIAAHANSIFDLVSLDRFTVARITQLVECTGSVARDRIPEIRRVIEDRLGEGAKEGGKSIRTQLPTRLDNPFTIREELSQAGFAMEEIVYTGFYPAPPFIMRKLPDIASGNLDEEKLAGSWIGPFLASNFLTISRKL